MAGKDRGGEEEEWQMESLSRLHGFELSMPKGPVSYTEDRSIGGHHIRAPKDELLRRLSRSSPDFPSHRASGEDNIYLP